MSDEARGPEGEDAKDWRTPVVIGLAVVVTVLAGIIIGYVVSGGLDDDAGAAVGATTTVPANPQTTVPGAPTATTLPPTVPPPTVAPTGGAPDTSIEGQITFPASEDTYTDSTEPSEINGFEPRLALENDPPELKLGLVRFSVADIPDGETVVRALLKLSLVSPPDQQVSVYLVDGAWAEMETSAGNAPLLGASVATIPAGGTVGQVVEVDVTAAVPGNGTVDFYLATGSDNTIEFASKESESPPRLTVIWNE